MISKEDALKGLNLTDKEISVYLSLHTLGQSSVNSIAKKANINRVTAYDILKGLSEKGFVSYVIKSGVRYYESADPTKFIDDLKEKQSKIEEVLPELLSLKASVIDKPQIETYEGIPGLKTIFNDMLKENKEMWFVGAIKMIESLEFYFPHFLKQKRKQKIFAKVITREGKKMREYKKHTQLKNVHIKFIDHDIDITKVIYGNKIAYLTFKEKNSIGVIIDNKEISNTERKLFDILWKSSKN